MHYFLFKIIFIKFLLIECSFALTNQSSSESFHELKEDYLAKYEQKYSYGDMSGVNNMQPRGYHDLYFDG